MEKQLEISADLNKLSEVLVFVNDAISSMGVDKKTKMDLIIVTEELFVNIASYAYGDNKGLAYIDITYNEYKNEIVMVFRDNGTPFNPIAKAEPNIEQDIMDRPIGGLGIFMVKKNTDDIIYEYNNGQNILRLIKKI